MSMYWPPIFASSGFGIHVGQYTGAWTLFASVCQPLRHAAGQAPFSGAAGSRGTRATANTQAGRNALMRDRVPRFSAGLALGGRPADERRDVTARDDDGVAACAPQLLHLRGGGQVGGGARG